MPAHTRTRATRAAATLGLLLGFTAPLSSPADANSESRTATPTYESWLADCSPLLVPELGEPSCSMSWDPTTGGVDAKVQDGGGDVGIVLRPAVPHAKVYEATLALDVHEAAVSGASGQVYACIGRAAEAVDGSEPLWIMYSCQQVIETDDGGLNGELDAPSSLPGGEYTLSSRLCVSPGDVVAAFLAVRASAKQRPLLEPLQEPVASKARLLADITSLSIKPRVAAHCREPR